MCQLIEENQIAKTCNFEVVTLDKSNDNLKRLYVVSYK